MNQLCKSAKQAFEPTTHTLQSPRLTQYPRHGAVYVVHLPLVSIGVHYLDVGRRSEAHAVHHCPLLLQGLMSWDKR